LFFDNRDLKVASRCSRQSECIVLIRCIILLACLLKTWSRHKNVGSICKRWLSLFKGKVLR